VINWFGPASWEAPICTGAPRCDTPVGDTCGRCGGAITETDSGVTMPCTGGAGKLHRWVLAFHLACHLKSILPHTLWPSAGLVPDVGDGLVDGKFECPSCGMVWSSTRGWMWKFKGV